MRLISLLFLITFFLQIFVPCKDMSVGMDKSQTEITSASGIVTVDAGHHMDHCSPFCQCACCACPAITQFALIFPAPVIFHLISYRSYIHPTMHQVHYAIWQPPQLTA